MISPRSRLSSAQGRQVEVAHRGWSLWLGRQTFLVHMTVPQESGIRRSFQTCHLVWQSCRFKTCLHFMTDKTDVTRSPLPLH